jgi:hypothetical protein
MPANLFSETETETERETETNGFTPPVSVSLSVSE